MMIPKKARYDFYKAVQSAQYHTRALLDHGAVIPENEALNLLDFLEPFRADLVMLDDRIRQQHDMGT